MGKKIDIVQNRFHYGFYSSSNFNDALSNKHFHDHYEIIFVSSGVGRLIVEGDEYPIRPGSLVLIPPFKYHHMYIDNEASVYERHLIHFPLDFLATDGQKILTVMFSDESLSCRFYHPHSIGLNIISLFDRFEEAAKMPERQQLSYTALIVSELMVLLSLTDSGDMPRTSSELGARVMRFLNENLDKDLSLDSISRHFFVSKYYLCRAFKRHNGISIHGYINQKRVINAKHLIDSGESASVAAYKVGFGDYSAFFRAYVKIVGTSPTAQTTRKGQGTSDDRKD